MGSMNIFKRKKNIKIFGEYLFLPKICQFKYKEDKYIDGGMRYWKGNLAFFKFLNNHPIYTGLNKPYDKKEIDFQF